MDLLKDAIINRGQVIDNEILKVDSFLNHQIDVNLLNEIGKELKKRFGNKNITKILTVEASGIAIACIVAQYFNVPVVFAKKTESKNLDKETYESDVYSFTKGKTYKIKVSKKYIDVSDRILVVDDFLANGRAAIGLKEIIESAGAELAGIGIVIEKGFQEGGQILRGMGVHVESLAIIDLMSEKEIKFK